MKIKIDGIGFTEARLLKASNALTTTGLIVATVGLVLIGAGHVLKMKSSTWNVAVDDPQREQMHMIFDAYEECFNGPATETLLKGGRKNAGS